MIRRKSNMSIVWFYCENCFKTEAKDLSKFQEIAESLEGFRWNKKGMFAYLNGFVCPHCGCYESTFAIDFSMIPIVRTLNDKGYTTRACCGGHNDSNCFYTEADNAYIAIEPSFTLGKYLDNKKQIEFKEIASTIQFTMELLDGDCICIRTRFNDTVSDERKKELGLSALSFAIFTEVCNFPENEDENKLIKYSYCNGDGVPYKDKEGE